jgi:hypothetical protein
MNKLYPILCLSAFLYAFVGCSEDQPTSVPKRELPPVVDPQQAISASLTPKKPVVYLEELDQFQEFFKEQHETSFSHVVRKNWTSYTAGKNGILTKVLLFGKPNYMISEHYGSRMGGFVRADNPDTGPKYGEWSLTRDEIVNQLALQGLTETDQGWITLQMRGEIPQEAGRMYFIVCDKIGDKRPWFGAFAFAEGNPYKGGRFWLHPDHDLVFRTYVGKTQDQLAKEQKGDPLFGAPDASIVRTADLPPLPKSMTGSGKNFEPTAAVPQVYAEEVSDVPSLKATEIKTEKTVRQEVVKPVIEIAPATSTTEPQPTTQAPVQVEPKKESTEVAIEANNSQLPKKSLFERFFRKEGQAQP